MLQLRDVLSEIKNAIDVPFDLGYNLDYDDCERVTDPIEDCLYDAGISSECEVANGVSKVVIIPRNSAYVIKTPLFGCYSEVENYNEENDEWYYDDEVFEDYENANYDYDGIDCSNYCELEAYIYNLAKENDVAEMFSKTEFYGNASNGRPLYISEKCVPVYWNSREASDASKTIVKEKRDSHESGWSKMSSELAALFVDDYGYEKATKFFNFLSLYEISDLHRGNIMISTHTNKIVLSDYSGFEH